MISISEICILLIALINGALLGNYITSAYHRIPLNKPINGAFDHTGIKPHCAACLHPLKYYEYFPILSWIFVGARCNYCTTLINPIYTKIEVCMMLCSILLYFALGMGTSYIFATLYLASMILLICLLKYYNQYYSKSFAYVLLSTIIFILVHEL